MNANEHSGRSLADEADVVMMVAVLFAMHAQLDGMLNSMVR
jgi:hypothetical protein